MWRFGRRFIGVADSSTLLLLPIPPMCPAHAVSRKLKRAQFAANVRVVQQLDREGLELLLRHQLPCWVKVRVLERVLE